jgi:hypothetical protein
MKIQYTFPIDRVGVFAVKTRMTVTGPERTAFVLLPPRGCRYNCTFCSLRKIRNKFEVTSAHAQQTADELDVALARTGVLETIKLSNGGNSLSGSESHWPELHELFWELLPDILGHHPSIRAVEIEVRIDDLIHRQDCLQEEVGIRQRRILKLSQKLLAKNIRLRLILGLEYDPELILLVRKFPSGLFSSQESYRRALCESVRFTTKEAGLEWLAYVMLGGRMLFPGQNKGQPIPSQIALRSAIHCALFAMRSGAREVIINGMFIDPAMARTVGTLGEFLVPTGSHFLEVAKAVMRDTKSGRLRLSYEAEPTIKGTIGPRVSFRFRKWAEEFNDVPNQRQFIVANPIRRRRT